MTKPTLVWTTHKLAEGWVLLCVDANLEQPGEPEALLGFRKAVHPFAFDEMADPVGEFTAVIAEMTKAVTFGLMAYAPTLPASRACAFGDPEVQLYRDGRDSVRPKAMTVNNMRELADASQRMHKRGGAL